MKQLVFPAITGIVLGFLASQMLFLQGYTLIPWGVAALIIGYISKSTKLSIISGLLYGFFLGFVFMIADYNGRSAVITKIPFFMVVGIFCAVCGVIISFASYFVKSKFVKNPSGKHIFS